MASQAVLELLIELKDNASSGLGGLGSALKTVGGIAGGVALAGVAAFGAAVVSGIGDARESATLLAQTEAVIKSTGGAAGVSAAQIVDYASALSDASGASLFGDDQIQQSENLLLTFTNIKDKTLEAATAISVDMAQALGGAPKDSAIQLGKALNDPIAGISALSRVGVTFTAEQKEQIKAMQEAGDMAGAQGVILAELNKEFGGSAQAAADATGGWSEFTGRLGEAKETLGAAVLPLLAVLGTFLLDTVVPAVEAAANAFAAWLADPAVQAGIQQIADAITTGLGVAFTFLSETAIPALIAAWGLIAPAIDLMIGAFSSGGDSASGLGGVINDLAGIWSALQPVIENVVNAIGNVVTAVFGVVQTFIEKHGADISAFMADAWNQIMAIVRIGIELYNAIVPPILNAVAGFIETHGDTIQRVLSNAWDAIKAVITAALAIIKGVLTIALDLIQGDWSGAWDAMQTMLSTVWASIQTIISGAWDNIKALFGGFAADALEMGAGIINSVIAGAKAAAGGLADMVANAVSDAIQAGKDALSNAGVPGFASGVRNFGGGLALVGERGPELVALPTGSNVYTASQSRQMLAGGAAGSNTTVNIGSVNTYAAEGQNTQQITDATLREINRRMSLRRA